MLSLHLFEINLLVVLIIIIIVIIIYHNNFFKALKNLLNDKNKDLYEFIGNKKTIDISEFIEILKENKFEIEDNNFDVNIFYIFISYFNDNNKIFSF